jgi:hypothetical protein
VEIALLGWDGNTWGPLIAAAALVVAFLARLDARKSANAAAETARQARRSTELAEEGLALERQRSHREIGDYAQRVAPRWEPTEPDERGFFVSDGEHLSGALRNTGLHGASIIDAALDVAGARAQVQTRCDGSASGGWESHPHVPPGAVLQMRCELEGLPIMSDARPMLYIDYDAPGLNHPPFGVTAELLRQQEDVRGRARWRLGAMREDIRA